MVVSACYALFLGCVLLIFSVATDAAISPAHAKEIMKEVGFTDSDIHSVFDERKLVKRILDPTNEREVAMAFAVVIKDSPQTLADIFISLRLKQKVDTGITGYRHVEEPSSVSDFDEVRLEPGGTDVATELVHATPQDDWNLSREEIAAFHKLEDGHDAAQKDRVEASLREMLLERYRSYRRHGLAGILPYARSKGSYRPGEDMHLSSKMSTVLKRETPSFYEHLAHFPNKRPKNLRESFSWVTFDADGKPNVELLHRCGVAEDDDSFFFSERQYYALNAYNCVHGEGGAVSLGEGIGTLLLFSSRTSTEAVTGFGGSAKRAIGVRMMGRIVADVLERYQEVQGTGEL